MKPQSSTSKNGASPPRRHQQGAVLVVGLIILVVLTLMGVQAMRTNLVQERMASNMRERNLAFQAAEAALRAGEARVLQATATDLPNPANWDGLAPAAGGSVDNFDAAVASAPVFHVGAPVRVYPVEAPVPGGGDFALDSDVQESRPYFFIYTVTARGVGGRATSVVLLQSTFVPADDSKDGGKINGAGPPGRQTWRQLR